MKLYRYVGPENIRTKAVHAAAGVKIGAVRDLEEWLRRSGQQANAQGQFVVTFVVDEQGCLRVADRGYQASARGGEVRVRVSGDRAMLGGQAVTVTREELLAQ